MKCTKRTKTEFQNSKQNCDQICRNFAPLTIIWKFLVLFWRFILYLAKCWLYPGNFLHYWAIFQCCKRPNTVKTIEPSGHTVFRSKSMETFLQNEESKTSHREWRQCCSHHDDALHISSDGVSRDDTPLKILSRARRLLDTTERTAPCVRLLPVCASVPMCYVCPISSVRSFVRAREDDV